MEYGLNPGVSKENENYLLYYFKKPRSYSKVSGCAKINDIRATFLYKKKPGSIAPPGLKYEIN